MAKGYRSYLPEQDLLLPPSLRDGLAESHLVYFVSDVVDHLDLSAIHAVYEKEASSGESVGDCELQRVGSLRKRWNLRQVDSKDRCCSSESQ